MARKYARISVHGHYLFFAQSGEGQGGGNPGEEGAGEGRKRENKGREAGSIWGWEARAEIKKAIVYCLLLGIIQSKTLV